jgi:hypothetical protein
LTVNTNGGRDDHDLRWLVFLALESGIITPEKIIATMSTALARDLANAQAKLAARAAEVAELEQKNAALRVRFAGLKLLVRGLTEIAEHRQMHGAAPGPLESLLDNLRAGMGAGGSTGAEPQEAASDPFFAELPHLAPGKQVLLLHEASEAEVAEVRAADAAAVKRLARGFHDAAARLSREIEAARAARDKAALARAQEEMRKEGVKFTRLSTLTVRFPGWRDLHPLHLPAHVVRAPLLTCYCLLTPH